MSTITLAQIYEKQGHIEDAKEVYESLLKNDPKNIQIQKALKRISSKNGDKISYFINMDKKEQFQSFEKWLVKPWN